MVKKLKELSNVGLDKSLVSDPSYGGCYSKDRLPPTLGPSYYIMNMQDEKDGGGTHWTLIDNRNPKLVSYFDSMGQVPPKEVKQLMTNTRKKKAINKFQLQSMGSDSCGWWCVAAATAMGGGVPMEDFILKFDLKNPEHNEQLLASMFS